MPTQKLVNPEKAKKIASEASRMEIHCIITFLLSKENLIV